MPFARCLSSCLCCHCTICGSNCLIRGAIVLLSRLLPYIGYYYAIYWPSSLMIPRRGFCGHYFIEELSFLLPLCIQKFGTSSSPFYHGTWFSSPAYMLELRDLVTCLHYGFRYSQWLILWISIIPSLLMILFYLCSSLFREGNE